MPNDLLAKIAAAGLVGRGGSAFPAAKKWERMVSLKNPKKVVVCNASEGEPGVKKDFHILKNFPEKMIKGMLLTMDFLGSKDAYININKDYYQATKSKLDPLIALCREKGYIINIFEEQPSYIGGETGALLNAIEGKKTQPRPDKPSPSVTGIFGAPVLLHNVETFYDIARVAADEYKSTRFSTILGGPKEGTFEVKNEEMIANILKETNNYPDFPFFVQIGGEASGEVLTSEQIETAQLSGCGSIRIYPKETTAKEFLSKLFNFYVKESCGKCTPCRDGSWQLKQMIDQLEGEEIPWAKISPIIRVMDKGAYCALGSSIVKPVRSYAKNILGIEV